MSEQNNAEHLKSGIFKAKAVLFFNELLSRLIFYYDYCFGEILQLNLKQSSLVIIYAHEHYIVDNCMKSKAYILIVIRLIIINYIIIIIFHFCY